LISSHRDQPRYYLFCHASAKSFYLTLFFNVVHTSSINKCQAEQDCGGGQRAKKKRSNQKIVRKIVRNDLPTSLPFCLCTSSTLWFSVSISVSLSVSLSLCLSASLTLCLSTSLFLYLPLRERESGRGRERESRRARERESERAKERKSAKNTK